MKQHTPGPGVTAKRTRRRESLDEMEKVIPRADQVVLLSPDLPEGKCGRSPSLPETMLGLHLYAAAVRAARPGNGRGAARQASVSRVRWPGGWDERLPDESTVLRFPHFQEKHGLEDQILRTVDDVLSTEGVMLKSGALVDATLIAAPSSTKNGRGERYSENK